MLHFMQLAHPRHMDIYVQNSKCKSQNTEVTRFEHRTQNICIQNTMSHIGHVPYVVVSSIQAILFLYIAFLSIGKIVFAYYTNQLCRISSYIS